MIKSSLAVENYGSIEELDENSSIGAEEELAEDSSGQEESKEGLEH